MSFVVVIATLLAGDRQERRIFPWGQPHCRRPASEVAPPKRIDRNFMRAGLAWTRRSAQATDCPWPDVWESILRP